MTELQRLHADTSADAAAIVDKMSSVIEATADFMADFVKPPPAGMGKASELWIGPPADGGEEGDPVNQVILPTAPGTSSEGGSSRLLVLAPAVSWPRVPAWGSLEPPRRDGENAQKTGKNGEKMGEIWYKK